MFHCPALHSKRCSDRSSYSNQPEACPFEPPPSQVGPRLKATSPPVRQQGLPTCRPRFDSAPTQLRYAVPDRLRPLSAPRALTVRLGQCFRAPPPRRFVHRGTHPSV